MSNTLEEINDYFYHSDHLGTATYVSDASGKPYQILDSLNTIENEKLMRQFFLNLPFGETMAEQRIGVYDNPYKPLCSSRTPLREAKRPKQKRVVSKFNGKELDDETALAFSEHQNIAQQYSKKNSEQLRSNREHQKGKRSDPTKKNSEQTGYYYGTRYDDPRISTFLSVDPLAEKTMSSYAYCYNNPIYYNDPTGMIAEEPDDWYKKYENGRYTFQWFNGSKDRSADGWEHMEYDSFGRAVFNYETGGEYGGFVFLNDDGTFRMYDASEGFGEFTTDYNQIYSDDSEFTNATINTKRGSWSMGDWFGDFTTSGADFGPSSRGNSHNLGEDVNKIYDADGFQEMTQAQGYFDSYWDRRRNRNYLVEIKGLTYDVDSLKKIKSNYNLYYKLNRSWKDTTIFRMSPTTIKDYQILDSVNDSKIDKYLLK